MRLLAALFLLALPLKPVVAAESTEYPGVARMQVQPGAVIVGDSFRSAEAYSISATSALINKEAAYFSYPSPIQGHAVTTYFFYAQSITLEFRCVVLANGKEVAENLSRVRVDLEPGTLYVARPELLDNYSNCETNVVPQQRPNKSFNRTRDNFRAGKAGLASWPRRLS